MVNIQLGTINGFPIIATFELPARRGMRPSRVIIVDRGSSSLERFVVSTHCENDPYWNAGNYCGSITEALDVFGSIVRRECASATSWNATEVRP